MLFYWVAVLLETRSSGGNPYKKVQTAVAARMTVGTPKKPRPTQPAFGSNSLKDAKK